MLKTHKNRKIKKPWKPLKTTKRIWKGSEAPEMVRAPKIHVSPNNDVMPVMLINSLKAVFCFICSFRCPIVFLMCLTRTITTTIIMTKLKSRTAKIGSKKAPKNTLRSPIKQLKKGRVTLKLYLYNHTASGMIIILYIQSYIICTVTIEHEVSINSQLDDYGYNGYHYSKEISSATANFPDYAYNSPQQTMETIVIVMWIKTIASFWNMSRASAPIHMTATRVK